MLLVYELHIFILIKTLIHVKNIHVSLRFDPQNKKINANKAVPESNELHGTYQFGAFTSFINTIEIIQSNRNPNMLFKKLLKHTHHQHG